MRNYREQMKNPDRISVRLALDAIEDQQAKYEQVKEHLKYVKDVRDDLIRDARMAGLSYRNLARATGLSADTLSTICKEPNSGAYQGRLFQDDPHYIMEDR